MNMRPRLPLQNISIKYQWLNKSFKCASTWSLARITFISHWNEEWRIPKRVEGSKVFEVVFEGYQEYLSCHPLLLNLRTYKFLILETFHNDILSMKILTHMILSQHYLLERIPNGIEKLINLFNPHPSSIFPVITTLSNALGTWDTITIPNSSISLSRFM